MLLKWGISYLFWYKGLSHPRGGSEMVNDKMRGVAYEKSKNNYYYFELPPGSTTNEARNKVVE